MKEGAKSPCLRYALLPKGFRINVFAEGFTPINCQRHDEADSDNKR
jgi:hypothetical protein